MKATNRFLWLSLVVIPLISLPTFGAPQTLPATWYRLPEDLPSPLRMSEAEERTGADQAAEGIERVIKANSAALDQVTEEERANPALTVSRGDWKFAALMLDLGLSGAGTMGVMVAKGEVTASLYWRRPQSRPELSDGESADLLLKGTETRAELKVKLEPVIRAVLATQEVKDEPAFRKNLLDEIVKYQDIVLQAAFTPERLWNVSKLRLDFSVDISGKVNPAVTVGGGVRLRFEWEPPAVAAVTLHRADDKELGKLLNTLSEAMRSLPYETLTPTGYQLNNMKFSLGLFGEGKFGVVKAGATVAGHLYLKKQAFAHPVQIPEDQVSDTIPVIEPGVSEEHLAYAQTAGVRATSWSYGGERGTLYSVPKEAFRQGIEKAVKLGAYLAERSHRSEGKSWELYQFKTEFALSLSGSVGLVSIGGTGAVELTFAK